MPSSNRKHIQHQIVRYTALVLLLAASLQAQHDLRERFALGVSLEETTIPLLRQKVRIWRGVSLELRQGVIFLQDETLPYSDNLQDAFMVSARGTFDLSPWAPLGGIARLYTGAEYGIFTAQLIKGKSYADGAVLGCFIGVEKYLSPGFSLCLDIGPYAINCTHQRFPIRVEGVDFVIHVLVNFYLF